jgi:hypothetical protein
MGGTPTTSKSRIFSHKVATLRGYHVSNLWPPLAQSLPYHYTTHSYASICSFDSTNIILHRV